MSSPTPAADQRVIYNNLEKPVSTDWNNAQTFEDLTWRNYIAQAYAKRSGIGPASDAAIAPTGFIADGLKVRPLGTPSMNVSITPGLGYQDSLIDTVDIGGISGLSDLGRSKPMVLGSPVNFGVPAAGGSTRVDIIEVKASYLVTDPQPRQRYNVLTQVYDPATLNKALIWDLATQIGQGSGAATQPLYYKIGTPGGGAPATDAGYIRIASIVVTTSTTVIDETCVTDDRVMIGVGGGFYVTALVTVPVTGAATLNALIAPPGVKGTVYRQGGSAGVDAAGVLVLFAGQNQFLPTAFALQQYASGSFLNPQVSGVEMAWAAINAITVDSGQQAAYQDTSITTTPLKTAIGQVGTSIAFTMPADVWVTPPTSRTALITCWCGQ